MQSFSSTLLLPTPGWKFSKDSASRKSWLHSSTNWQNCLSTKKRIPVCSWTRPKCWMEHSKTYRPLMPMIYGTVWGITVMATHWTLCSKRLKILSKPKESSTLLWKGWSSKKKKTRPNWKWVKSTWTTYWIRPPLIAGLRNARNCSINTIYWKQTSLYWITRASTHKVSYTNAWP